MNTFRTQALNHILNNDTVLNYVRAMKTVESCCGTVIEINSSNHHDMKGIHFIVSTDEAYSTAYKIRLKYVFPKQIQIYRQVIFKKDFVTSHLSETNFESIVQEYCESQFDDSLDLNDNEDLNLFFCYHGKTNPHLISQCFLYFMCMFLT